MAAGAGFVMCFLLWFYITLKFFIGTILLYKFVRFYIIK